MQVLARAVGRRKEAVAQIQIIQGTGQFLINNKPAKEYLEPVSQKHTDVQSPFEVFQSNLSLKNLPINAENISLDQLDTIVKVKGGGLSGQSDAIKLGIARAFCSLVTSHSSKTIQQSAIVEIQEKSTNDVKALEHEKNQILKKQFKIKGYLTQDSRVKERRKYGLKKARKASQYHKR